MGQKKDTRQLGRRRKAQAQSQQEAVKPSIKPSMSAPSPKNKVDKNPETKENTPTKAKRNAGAVGFLKRIQRVEIRDFTAARLQRFKPSGFISRAEKIMVRRRLTIVAIFLSILAAVLAGITNYAMVDSTPRRAVDSYMSALQGGHYLRALGRSVYRDDTAVLLKDSMYRAGEGRVENYEIKSLDEKENTATATVDAVVSGAHKTVTLKLHKVVRTGIFNDLWELDTEPQITEHVTAPLALDSVLVNGKKLRLGEGTTVADNNAAAAWNIPLLPGDYQLALSENSYYTFASDDPQITVSLNDAHDANLNLKLRPSPRMWNETNDAINSWLETCTNSRSVAPRGCPVSSMFKDDGTPVAPTANASATSTPSATPSADIYQVKHAKVTDVKWELIQAPLLALEHSDGDFSTWTANDQAKATYRLTYTVDDTQYTETIPFTIDAEVHSTGDSAHISAGLKSQGDAKVSKKAVATATPSSSTSK